MQRSTIIILAICFFMAVIANIMVSFRTRNWAFGSPSQHIAHRYFKVLNGLTMIWVFAFLLGWMDSFLFFVVAVGGQILWQIWLTASKLIK